MRERQGCCAAGSTDSERSKDLAPGCCSWGGADSVGMRGRACGVGSSLLDRGLVAASDASTTARRGSERGGCQPSKRSTEIDIACDPCNHANISTVSEPEKCQYKARAGESAVRPVSYHSVRFLLFCVAS